MKKKKFEKLGLRSVFILMLACFLIFPGKSLLAEIAYEGVKEKIPEFPAPWPSKDYEPDWKNYPWFPVGNPEKFDINQPNAAEKLIWLAKDNFDGGWCNDTHAHWMDSNRFGHIRNVAGNRVNLYFYDRKFVDLLTYKGGKVNPGDLEFKDYMFQNFPTQVMGLANLTWKYVESPAVKKEQERWIYIPALRRTRRLAAGADDDKIVGTDITIDDAGQREVWEEEYTLIGEDVLTEDEHTFYMLTPKAPKMLEEWKKFPPYRPKGGFDCWVLYGVNRKARYYFPKRLIWIDKRKFLPVREEQYNKHGNLWKIYDYGWLNKKSKYNPDAPDIPTNNYFYWIMWNVWDLTINHRTILNAHSMRYDKDCFLNYTGKGSPPHTFFDVKRLEREEWGRPTSPPPRTKSLDELVPIPRLRREVFKQYRPIILPEELEEKLIEEYKE